MKAERTTIELGNISLDVYMLPSGEYRLSKASCAEVIGLAKNAPGRYLKSTVTDSGITVLESLTQQGLSTVTDKITIARSDGSSMTFEPISLEVAVSFWAYCAKEGNAPAISLLEACAIEAIERRADKAFGNQRAEEEYQQRTAARMNGKVARRSFTDQLKAFGIESAVDVPYGRITLDVYRLCNIQYDNRIKNFRDTLSTWQLLQVEQVERTIALFMSKGKTYQEAYTQYKDVML